MAMSYGHVYVASVAFRRDTHTVQAIREAESFDGPAIVIAYSHCIAHGYDLRFGADQQKLAVNSGIWPLYRFDPRRITRGEPPLVIDAPAGRNTVEEYRRNEADSEWLRRSTPCGFDNWHVLPSSKPWSVLPSTSNCRISPYPTPATRPGHRQWRGLPIGGLPMDLSTTYMGFELPHPLIPGASPLVDDLDTVRRLEDAGHL